MIHRFIDPPVFVLRQLRSEIIDENQSGEEEECYDHQAKTEQLRSNQLQDQEEEFQHQQDYQNRGSLLLCDFFETRQPYEQQKVDEDPQTVNLEQGEEEEKFNQQQSRAQNLRARRPNQLPQYNRADAPEETKSRTAAKHHEQQRKRKVPDDEPSDDSDDNSSDSESEEGEWSSHRKKRKNNVPKYAKNTMVKGITFSERTLGYTVVINKQLNLQTSRNKVIAHLEDYKARVIKEAIQEVHECCDLHEIDLILKKMENDLTDLIENSKDFITTNIASLRWISSDIDELAENAIKIAKSIMNHAKRAQVIPDLEKDLQKAAERLGITLRYEIADSLLDSDELLKHNFGKVLVFLSFYLYLYAVIRGYDLYFCRTCQSVIFGHSNWNKSPVHCIHIFSLKSMIQKITISAVGETLQEFFDLFFKNPKTLDLENKKRIFSELKVPTIIFPGEYKKKIKKVYDGCIQEPEAAEFHIAIGDCCAEKPHFQTLVQVERARTQLSYKAEEFSVADQQAPTHDFQDSIILRRAPNGTFVLKIEDLINMETITIKFQPKTAHPLAINLHSAKNVVLTPITNN